MILKCLWLLWSLLHFTVSYEFAQFELENELTFDFIIVGGGTGGCVVARRLAETKKYTVLVIQEGGVANDNLNIPALSDNFQDYRYPNEMKYYYSVPQKSASLASGGVTSYPIGIAIGGGSSVNGLTWNRGNSLDYDNWAEILNDSSWNYENMLPFFRKTENYRGLNPTNQRGKKGPISIENTKDLKYGAVEFLEAAKEIGYKMGEPNSPQTPGASLMDSSNYRGRRVSAFSGYIGPLLSEDTDEIMDTNLQKPHLIILLNTKVKRIIFEGEKAVGVTFENQNSSQTGFVRAKKEVILSAGTMDSPAILMRSGIGPKSVLDSAKIPVVKYLEGVGKNLQDHVAMPLFLIFGNSSIVFTPSHELTPAAWKEYQQFGTGPYSLFRGSITQGIFLSSVHSSVAKNWPDIFIHAVFEDSTYLGFQLSETKPDERVVDWLLLGTRNKSRGTLILNQILDDPPVIDFNFLDNPDDLKAMVDGFKLCKRMCEETATMQKVGCRLPSTPFPGCDQFEVHSDSYFECVIKLIARAGIHAAGTCKMGTKDDPEAVVDSQLKVIGIKNLRIADASVMPVVTNANTQAPVYAIAERAANMILMQFNN